MTVANRFDGQVAIITGASRGIGEAIARRFVAEGAKCVLSARKAEALEAVASELGDAAVAVPAHAGKKEDCERLVSAACEKFGKVDIVVNNAATNPHFGPMLGVDMGAWDKTFEVNLKGAFWMTQALVDHLTSRGANGGAVVNIASVVGLMSAPLQGVYAMTKAAMISMTKTLAFELAAARIRVNAIAPGFIDTRFSSAIVHNDEMSSKVVERTPLGRIGKPEEIAGGAAYLASNDASFLTGHTLVIDGGMTIS